MRTFYIAILFILISQSGSVAQELPHSDLVDRYGKIYTEKELSENNVFFLVVSLGCVYCVRDIPYYNSLAEKYAGLTDVKFVVLLQNNLNTIKNYKGRDFFSENWIVIPEARDYYSKIWKKRSFPEYIVYLKGRRHKSFAYSSPKTKAKIEKYLAGLSRMESKSKLFEGLE
jgi:thiol-disulfide isomerase/thioredoxin